MRDRRAQAFFRAPRQRFANGTPVRERFAGTRARQTTGGGQDVRHGEPHAARQPRRTARPPHGRRNGRTTRRPAPHPRRGRVTHPYRRRAGRRPPAAVRPVHRARYVGQRGPLRQVPVRSATRHALWPHLHVHDHRLRRAARSQGLPGRHGQSVRRFTRPRHLHPGRPRGRRHHPRGDQQRRIGADVYKRRTRPNFSPSTSSSTACATAGATRARTPRATWPRRRCRTSPSPSSPATPRSRPSPPATASRSAWCSPRAVTATRRPRKPP